MTMRRCAIVICALGAAVPVSGQDAQLSDAALAAAIQAYLTPAAAQLSGNLLVARGDRVVFERSYGMASHELRVPFNAATPTAVASITKPLTVLVATRLVNEGRLSLDDTVSRWLPEFLHGHRMTVRQLIGHRAGIPHRLLPDEAQNQPRTASDMVAAANALPLLFPPGERYSYSSGGYSILAAVLERAGGASYDGLLQKYVVAISGSRLLRHIDRRELLVGRATSGIAVGDRIINAPLRDLSFLVGAGSVYSTPRDVLPIIHALTRGLYGSMATGYLVDSTGFAWSGITNGFRAIADWYRKDSLTVLFFGNVLTGAVELMRRDIPRLARGEITAAMTIPRIIATPLRVAVQERIAGDYDAGDGVKVTLRFLSSTLALFGERALVPLDDTTLFSPSDYAHVTVARVNSGQPVVMQWGPSAARAGTASRPFTKVNPRLVQ